MRAMPWVIAAVVVFAGLALFLRLATGTLETDCFVQFPAGDEESRAAFQADLVDEGWEVQLRPSSAGKDHIGAIASGGGLLSSGSGLEEDVRNALAELKSGQLSNCVDYGLVS